MKINRDFNLTLASKIFFCGWLNLYILFREGNVRVKKDIKDCCSFLEIHH